MGHTWINGSPVDKRFTIGKNESNSEKWVIFGKMGHTNKNGSALEKWVTLTKMAHHW